MMNYVKYVLTLVLTAASAVSCLKEVAVRGVEPGELMLNPQVDALTKAPIAGTEFPNDRTIILSAYYNDTSEDFFSNIPFALEAAKDSWTGGGGTSPRYWPASGTLDLLAYSADGFSPALTPVYNTENCSTDVTLMVTDNSTAQVDILWAGVRGKSPAPDPLAMTFRHAEAAVAFDAKAEVPYDGTANLGITIDRITLKGVKSVGKVKLNIDGSCVWSDQATPNDIPLPGIPTSGYNVTADCITTTAEPFVIGKKGLIVIPQTATSFTVNYTVHYGRNVSGLAVDKEETFDYTINYSPWNAGTKYVYELFFKQDEILVATDIYDWTDSPSGVPVPEPVSATYMNTGATKIDLGGATLSAGGVVGIDWGSGRRQIFENTSTGLMAITELQHSYHEPPADSVKIYVRKGVLDFGAVSNTQYNRFHVYNDDEVKIQKTSQSSLHLNDSDNGTVILSYPGGTVPEGETGSVYKDETVTVNASPDDYYVIDKMFYILGVVEDGGTEYPIENLSFKMPGTTTEVFVTFKKMEYELTAEETGHGSFTLMNTDTGAVIASGSSVAWDTPVTVVPSANTGYVVDKVQYTCGGVTTDATLSSDVYSFEMPKGDTSVRVTFKIQVPGDILDAYDIETWTTTS